MFYIHCYFCSLAIVDVAVLLFEDKMGYVTVIFY